MAMVLTYDPTFSSVHIELSAITPDGTVRIERSANNGPPWQVIRGGLALPIFGGVADIDDYEFYADVENFYRVLRVTPAPGLQLSGTPGGYASTPDDPALDIVGDIDLRIDAAADDWTAAGFQTLMSKDAAAPQVSWRWSVSPEGLMQLSWSEAGSVVTSVNSTVPIPAADGERIALRVTFDVDDGVGGHVITFYTSDSIDGPWTPLGTPITGTGATSIFNSTAPVEVGSAIGGAVEMFTGIVSEAQIYNGIDGTAVANPDFAAQADGATNFVDAAGRTWTINGGAVIISGEPIEEGSITPSLNGETWLKSIRYPALNRAIPTPDYRPVQRASRAGLYNIKGRSTPTAVYDIYSSRWWTVETATNMLAQARDMDLVLAAGGTWFIHVPAENENECFTNPVSGMPGGYVEIQSATMIHTVPGSHVMAWTLPVRQVTPPGPEITSTLLTWATVKRLYGSWTALWAANPTWKDLWSQIMDPEDTVVF